MWRSYTRHRGSAKKKVPSDANVGFRKATGGFIVERFTKGLARLVEKSLTTLRCVMTSLRLDDGARREST